MAERRYTEQEAEQIFERAAEAQHSPRGSLAAGGGMTLRELQEIGREVGIPDELVASASRSLERPATTAPARFLGFPIGVSRTVELDRTLSDDEWHRLVVDLRETFDARGRITEQGAFREWTNGNLHALLEPTDAGHRLRMRTVKGDARSTISASMVAVVFAVLLLFVALSSGASDAGALAASIVLLLGGVGVLGASVVRLPSWAAARQRQMDDIAARLQARIAAGDEREDERPG